MPWARLSRFTFDRDEVFLPGRGRSRSHCADRHTILSVRRIGKFASRACAWNQNECSFGVELPYGERLMLDTFYQHQNCTTRSHQGTNVLGIILNLYFKQPKK